MEGYNSQDPKVVRNLMSQLFKHGTRKAFARCSGIPAHVRAQESGISIDKIEEFDRKMADGSYVVFACFYVFFGFLK